MNESPQSSSTSGAPAPAPRTLPGCRSPWTSVSGRPHAATARSRSGSPASRPVSRRSPRATTASRADRRRSGTPAASSSGDRVRRDHLDRVEHLGDRGPDLGAGPVEVGAGHIGQQHPTRVVGGEHRGDQARRGTGDASAAPPARGRRTVGTCLSHTVPASVSSCQIVERFQVRSCRCASERPATQAPPRPSAGSPPARPAARTRARSGWADRSRRHRPGVRRGQRGRLGEVGDRAAVGVAGRPAAGTAEHPQDRDVDAVALAGTGHDDPRPPASTARRRRTAAGCPSGDPAGSTTTSVTVRGTERP